MKTSTFVRTNFAALALAVSASVLAVSSASAGGFAITEQSTYALGNAFAGAAAGGSLSTTFWNPAALGEVGKWDYEGDLTAILPFVSVTTNPFGPFPAQRNSDVGIGVVVPATYSAYRINQNLILGLNVNSPFGLATAYGTQSYLALAGVANGSRVMTINVNPNVAYQVNDQLTFAIGLQAQYMELRESAFGAATGDYTGRTKDIGIGYTLGVDWKPMKGTSLGIGYRSGITNTIAGTLSGVPLPTPPFPAGTLASFDGTLKVKTPGILTIGASQDLNEFWTVKAGATWTNWSVLGTVPVSGPAAAVITSKFGSPSIPFKYQDAWMFSVGADYKYRPDVTFRGGFAYEVSPIGTAARNYRLPDADRLWFTTGMTYSPSKAYSIDVSYAYLRGLSSNINSALTGGPATNGPVSGSYNANIHILSMALKVKLDQVFGPGAL